MNTTAQQEPRATSCVPRVEVVVVDEFDLSAVPRLSTLFRDALALQPKELIVDLAGCSFIDAAAISLLLDVHRQARRAGGLLTLRDPSPRLRRNLRLARVDGVLDVIPAQEPPQPPAAGETEYQGTGQGGA